MKKDNVFDYKKTKAELDEILAWFENSDVSLDEALDKYKMAEDLLKELEAYLIDTQAKIQQITKKLDK